MKFYILCFLALLPYLVGGQTLNPSTNTSFCDNGNISVVGAAPGTTFQWQLNSTNIGTNSSALNVTTSGNYRVILEVGTVKDTLGPVSITVNQNPVATFTHTTASGCMNTPIQFTYTGGSTGLTYIWDFDDPVSPNNTSTQANPTHRFIGDPGNGTQTFTVRLTVINSNGCSAIYTRNITLSQSPSTTLNGTNRREYNNSIFFTNCTQTTATFIFTNPSPPITTNTNYQIIWGDGTPNFNSPTFVSQTHVYTTGLYNLQYIVSGANGCIDTADYKVFVGTNPAIGFGTPGSSDICTSDELNFIVSGFTNNPPSTLYTVTFNDGTPAINFNHPPPTSVSHIFDLTSCGVNSGASINSFTATIEAHNACSRSTVNVMPIYVSEKPVPNFTITPNDTVCVNNLVTITNTSPLANYNNNGDCSPGNFIWKISPNSGYSIVSGNLGDDFGFTDAGIWSSGSGILQLRFNNPGLYSIELWVGNSKCGNAAITKTICVTPEPAGSYTVNNNEGCAPFNITTNLTNNTPTCGTMRYSWSVSYSPASGCAASTSGYSYVGGTSATSQSPQIRFTNPGIYTIQPTLIAPASACSTVLASQQIIVKDKPVVSIGTLPPSICAGESVSPTGSAGCYIDGSSTYAWTFGGASPSSSTALNPGNITFNTTGNAAISLNVTNTCGTTAANTTINVLPTPLIDNISDKSICANETSAAIPVTTTPAAGVSVTWTNSNSTIGLAASGSGNIPSFNAVNIGSTPVTATITVRATLGTCFSTKSFTITVNPKPAPVATSPVSYCVAETAVPLTATASGGNQLLWYTVPTGGTGSTTAPTPSTAAAGVTTYYVAQLNTTTNCESVRTPLVVTVHPIPTITDATGVNPTICANANGSIRLTGLTANTNYTVTYTSSAGNQNVSLTSNASGVIIISNLPAGSYSNIRVASNGCTSLPVGPVSLSDPSAPAAPTITDNGPICSGQTLTLETPSITGATYSWVGPNGFTSTLRNPSIPSATVAASGTYSVTVTVSGCTSPAATSAIVVNPTPLISVSGNSPVCSGETIQLTSNVTYSGSVDYTWTGPATFTSTDANPEITSAQATNSGTYQLIVTGSVGNCPSAPATVNMVVNLTPAITTITSTNPNVCSTPTGTISISGLTSGATYQVNYTRNSSPQTASLTANASGVVIITGLIAGVYENFEVVLNGCSDTDPTTITLSDPTPPAAPTITHNGPICSGQTLTLETPSNPSATYSWVGPNGFTSTLRNPSIPSTTVAASGTYSVTVTVSGCTSPAATSAIVVNPTPVVSVYGNSPVCSGETIQLTSNVTYSGSVDYTWTGPATFTSTDANPEITSAQATNSGTYQLIVTGSAGNCPSTPATVNIVVNPTPAITTITSTNPNLCSTPTGTINIGGLTAGATYLVNYTRNSTPQTASITANASGVVIITGLIAGIYENFEVVLNGCSDTDPTTITLSDPNPPAAPTATTNAPVCSGNTIQLNASPNVTGGTFNWTGPNGFTSTNQNPTISNSALVHNGDYHVTVTVSGCTSMPGTVNVVVNETPATPIVSSNSPICNGNTLQLSATTGFVGSLSYAWTGPNGFTDVVANPTIANAQPINSGIYTLVITSVVGNCPSQPATTSAIVHLTPIIASATGSNPTQCSTPTGSITLSGLQPSVSFTVSYEFNTTPVTLTLSSNASGILIIPALLAGTYTNITVEVNGCTSTPANNITLNDPNPPAPPTLTQNGPVCTNETIQLSASTSEPGTPSYSWTGPSGYSGNNASFQITNATSANGGTYQATVTIDNCTSPAASIIVVVNPLPNAPVVSTPVEYCINTTALPLTATATGGNSLNWYLGANQTNPVATAPTPLTTTIGSTSFYVSQTNGFGCEGDDIEIVVKINPDAQALFTPTETIACPPFTIDASVINLQTFPTLNDTYQWFADGILIGTGTTFPGYTLAQQNDSVAIRLITTSLYGCLSDTISHKFYTYKTPVPTFTQDISNDCGPLNVTFTNTTNDIALYNYFWNFGNGITSNQTHPGTITFEPNPQSGDTTYNVTLTISTSCGDYTVSHPVTVKAKPIALFTPSRTVGCSPMTVTFTNTSRGNNVVYDWDFGNGQTQSTTNNNTVTNTYNTGVVDTFTVRLIATNECGADTSFFDLIVAPNNINLNFQFNGPDQFGCAPHTVPFINNTPGANVFQWNFGDGNILSTTRGNDTIYHTFQNPGTYTITLWAQNACTDTSGTRTITVFENPEASFTADRYTVCIGEQVQFNNTSDAATSYLWNFGDGNTSTLVNPVHSYATAGTYTVKLNIYRVNAPGNICVDSVEHQIQVGSNLPGSFTIRSVGSCVPMTVTFINDQRPSQTATWDFGDGQTATGDSVVHIYNNPGVYTIRLVAITAGGCTYTSTQVITVNGVSGSLTYNGGFVCIPDPNRFVVSGTNIQSVDWDFGDGTTLTSTQLVQFHNYQNPGAYIPSIVLHSADGCTYPIRGTDTIKVDKISAGFTHNIEMHCGYTTVNFLDTSSVFYGKNEVRWDFGDGTTGTGISLSHDYSVAGVYTIQMTVLGNSGCVEIVTKQITIGIHHVPIVAINGRAEGCTNEPLTFVSNVQSIDQINHFQWNLSNGPTFTTPNFDYAFLTSGTFTVRLVAGTEHGCFDTAFHTIQIKQSPTVIASPDVSYCVGGNAQLSVVGAVSYQWTPVAGLSCDDCPNPLTNATVTTRYLVTGLAANGCTATDTVNVTVIQPLQMTVSPNDSICIGQSANLMASGAASYIWSPGATLSNTTISNPVATPTNTTTYRVIGYDGHGCFTDTAFVVVGVGLYPTVSLGPDLQLSSGTNHPLTSVVTNGPIEHWEWTPPQDLDCADCETPTAYIRNNITYSVRVETFYGCEATDEVNIRVFCTDGQVFIPNAFTPDGDGINDILMVRGTGIARVKTFRIFNRWGEVVFERSNFSPNDPTHGWNGTVRGKIAQPDVFVYTAEVVCDNGTPYTYKGNVSIIK